MRKNFKLEKEMLLYLPAILVVILTVIYPFIMNFTYSFTDYTLVNPDKPFVGLANYIEVFQSEYFLDTVSRTLIWTVTNIFFMLLLGLSTALLFDTDIKGLGILKATILIPWVIPTIVTGYTFKWMFTSEFGIINTFLSNIGLISADYSWFRTGWIAFSVAILANVWRGFPFFALMLYAKLKSLPADLLEAAQIDGANKVQVFRYITLPYLSQTIVSVSTLGFIWTFNAFGIILSLTNGGPMRQTETFPFIVQRTAFEYYEFGQASTMSVYMFTIMALSLAAFRLLRKLGKNAEGGF